MTRVCLLFVAAIFLTYTEADAYELEREVYACVVDQCEENTCTIETPEGFVVVNKKESYYEGKKLTAQDCPIEYIDPT